jgi:hypothetical protein
MAMLVTPAGLLWIRSVPKVRGRDGTERRRVTPKRLWKISCGERSLEVLRTYQLALRFAAGTTYVVTR